MRSGIAPLGVVLTVMMATACTQIAPEASRPASQAAPTAGPGWTGLSKPTEIIAARTALMEEMEQLMIPLDSYTAGDKHDPDLLRANAAGVARLLKVVPHLFPPTTNLYQQGTKTPATLALPVVWQNFDSFYSLAAGAQEIAEEFASTQDPVALKPMALAIRGACKSCHDSFLLEYKPESVTEKDTNFDFGTFK